MSLFVGVWKFAQIFLTKHGDTCRGFRHISGIKVLELDVCGGSYRGETLHCMWYEHCIQCKVVLPVYVTTHLHFSHLFLFLYYKALYYISPFSGKTYCSQVTLPRQDKLDPVEKKGGGWVEQLTSSTVKIPDTLDHIINFHSALFLGYSYCFLGSFKPEYRSISLGRSCLFYQDLLCFVVNLFLC